MNSSASQLTSIGHPQNQLIELISPLLAPLGYQVVHLEVQSHRQKVLRVFIDFLEPSAEKTIGIEDCVKVSHKLDEALDQIPEVQAAFPGAYELEVSSPGINRPLRTTVDFERFAGQKVRVHVYRPLTDEELENKVYQEKNPKQKNFLGTLVGFQKGKVLLSISQKEDSAQKLGKKSKLRKKADFLTNSAEGSTATIALPLPLISKANLEPDFMFEESEERE